MRPSSPAVSALLVFAVISTSCLLAPGEAAAQTPVDLELVLAVDVSLSMDLDEQRLQRDGYVAAFRDPEVHAAIASGPHGRIAVTYVEWAGPPTQQVVVGWTVIDGAASAGAFADKLQAATISRARMTSISAALQFSGQLFETSGVRGIRRVIDVSGDGPNNAGVPVAPARDALVARGIVINGLPIVNDRVNFGRPAERDLDQFYDDEVIGGPGAFLIPAEDFNAFSAAILNKLIREIAALPADE